MFDWRESTQLSKFDSRREACSVAVEHARTSRPDDRAEKDLVACAYQGYHQAYEHRAALVAVHQAASRRHRQSDPEPRRLLRAPLAKEGLAVCSGGTYRKYHLVLEYRSARTGKTGTAEDTLENLTANSDFDPMEVGPLTEVDEGHSMTRWDAMGSTDAQSCSLRRLNLGSLHLDR